ncbi:MAG: hypothetical protein J07HX64_00503 [halophilic archaeon J07HX64]|nr:MAG: hypothetical protein J07HX64_00503 [halophilic archaeon J07HX64]
MTDGPDIGGRSRRFQASVIAVTLLALLAGALAAASLSGNGDVLDLGTDGGGGGEPIGDSAGGGSGGGSGGGGGGGNIPGFVNDIFGWLGDGQKPADVEPGEIEVPSPPYDITVEPEPTPGARVTVTVEKDGDPVPFVPVSFNGEVVGMTAPTGQLLAQVPYTEELRVTAAPPAIGGDGDEGSDPVGPSGTPSHLGSGSLAQSEGSNSSATYDVQTDVTARVDGVALPGRTATVQFVVAGNPLPEVGVTSNGEGVGITDRSGTVEFEVPPDAPLGGSVPVELTREEFTDDTSVEVARIEIDINTGLLALPSTGATAEVTAVDSTGSEPIADVPVTVTSGGEQMTGGQTGKNGTTAFTLPWSNSVTATATTEYGSVSTTARGILLEFAGAVVALALPVVGAVFWARGNPATRRRLRERLVGAMLAAGRLLDSAARRVAGLPVGGAVGWLWNGLAGAAGRLWAGVGRLGASLAGLRGGSWLTVVFAGPRWLLGRLRAGLAWLVGLPARLFGGNESVEQQAHGGESAETSTAQTDAVVQEPQSAYGRLRRYWLWLVRRVAGRAAGRTKTPVEIERRAVQRGLPADAVRRLRRAFQAVEYGPADAEERVGDAESARGQLQQQEQEREEDSERNA